MKHAYRALSITGLILALGICQAMEVHNPDASIIKTIDSDLLYSDQVVLRSIKPDDADALYALLTDPIRKGIGFENKTADMFKRFVTIQSERHANGTELAYTMYDTQTDNPIGMISITKIAHFSPCAAGPHNIMAGWISQPFWGKSIFFQAASMLIAHFFAKNPDTQYLFSAIRPWNNRALKSYLRLGFTYKKTIIYPVGSNKESFVFQLSRPSTM